MGYIACELMHVSTNEIVSFLSMVQSRKGNFTQELYDVHSNKTLKDFPKRIGFGVVFTMMDKVHQ